MWTSISLVFLCLQFHIIKGQTESTKLSNERYQFVNGRDGAPGRDGRDGIIGPQGPPGFPGFPGHKGEQGEPGKHGQKGERGDVISASGLQGPPGPIGMQGPKGSTGPRGLPGTPGIEGQIGRNGSKGMKGEKGSLSESSNCVTYTRWGKRSCRSGVTLVYSGSVGASYYTHGGGSNYLCMPSDPQYTLPFTPGVQGYSYLYGAEYEASPIPNRNNHNAQCAVCLSCGKTVSLMIPAKTSCPSGWTREYYGYLMAEHINHTKRTEFVCVDSAMDSVPGSQSHINAGHLWHVEGHCDGVPCPPYNNYKELNCVVCTK